MPSVSRRVLVAALAAGALLACGGGPARRPNVVVVVIDTLRADHTSLHAYMRDTTPAIAAWAEGGTVFENAASCSSWTLPSMTMLFAGRAVIGKALGLQIDTVGTRGEAALATLQPIAESFQRAGYQTAAVVANPLLSAENGFTRGFERYDVQSATGEHASTSAWPGEEVVERGLAMLEARDERPFFLFLHLFDPHEPYGDSPRTEFPPFDHAWRRERFAAAVPEVQKPRWNDEVYRAIEREIALYDSDVAHADRALGRLFERLEDEGLDDETLVVVTADHGEGLWQRPVAADTKSNNAVFRPLYSGHGEYVYSEQVHVPLVLRGPGVPEGQRDGRHVSLLDVYPTLLALAGVAGPVGLEGSDLFSGPGPTEVYSWCQKVTSVTVEGRWRLHWPARQAAFKGRSPKLFDLRTDPRELTPIVDPAKSMEYHLLIDQFEARGAAAAAVLQAPSAAQLQQLQALGYVDQTD